MRSLQYLFVILVIAATSLYLAPYVGSEPVRVEQELPPKIAKEQKRKKKEESFWTGPLPSVKISFDNEEWENLRRDHRRYAKGKLVEGAATFDDVAVKLKGSVGSFQGPDGKPGLTVNFDMYKGAERFHGLKKIHFNNGAQDGTFLQEMIAGEMARKAGVPASHCTHGFVEWQGRDLGLFVVKEAFTKDFLKLFYKNPEGDLYDGGFVRGIDENSEKDMGDPNDKTALKELIEAGKEPDNAKRWERFQKILDVEEFAAHCAMEAILCHWDGYSFNNNNYRFYRDVDSGKFSFFLHGMDQTFGDENFPLKRDFGAQISNAFMRCPQGSELYMAKLKSIYETVLKPIDWGARVTEVGAKVREAMGKRNPQAAKDYSGGINEARDRIVRRIAAVGKQLGDVPKPVSAFDKGGVVKLAKDWRTEGTAAQIEERMDDGKACLYIRADGEANASWRTGFALEAGKYRFEARMRTKGVAAAQTSSGEAAGVRISGGTRNGVNAVAGDSPWKVVAFPFEHPGGEVVFVAELRATRGEVWFEKGSLQLVRAK